MCAHTVLFHLDIVPQPPKPQQQPDTFEARLADCHPNLRSAMAAYLERKCGTCRPKTVSSLATRPAHFGRFLAEHDAWLKVPLGKPDTERMVPLDDETVAIIDRITATRSTGRPLPHPRTARATQFLFTHHGCQLSQTAVRTEPARSAETAGIGHATPHQLRHTYATALVNAGVSLQALMALLGHVSPEMTLRHAHLFDSTARAEYERSPNLAKARIGAMPTPTGRPRIPVTANGGCASDDDWRDAPAIKARLAGGHCPRAPAQGACPYANICEHCPSFRADAASATVPSAQRVDTRTLLADAQTRGWIDEADRHRRLLDRLETLIANTA